MKLVNAADVTCCLVLMFRFSSRGQQTDAHHSRPRLWDRMVVGVPLLSLSVDLTVSPIKRLFHLVHGKGAHCRASRSPFVPY